LSNDTKPNPRLRPVSFSTIIRANHVSVLLEAPVEAQCGHIVRDMEYKQVAARGACVQRRTEENRQRSTEQFRVTP
jgi:hypothetical protein